MLQFLGNFETNFWGTLLNWIILLVGTYVFLKLLLYTARWIHAVLESREMVFIKILTPRSESKKDKEEQVEKDFKERVAIMDGLYRSVYEIQELNLKNRIRTFFWNNDYVSFELVYDKKLIHFYIATHKRYSELLQKQILTYYPDADVAEVEPY